MKSYAPINPRGTVHRPRWTEPLRLGRFTTRDAVWELCFTEQTSDGRTRVAWPVWQRGRQVWKEVLVHG